MDNRERLIFAIVASALMLVGVLLIILGAWRWRVERAFVARAAQAPGAVIGFRQRRVGSGHRRPGGLRGGMLADFPIVRYRPDGGPEIEFESAIGSSPRAYHEGQVVTILYDPADLQHGIIEAGWRQHLLPLFLIGVGIFLAIFGGIYGVVAWSQG